MVKVKNRALIPLSSYYNPQMFCITEIWIKPKKRKLDINGEKHSIFLEGGIYDERFLRVYKKQIPKLEPFRLDTVKGIAHSLLTWLFEDMKEKDIEFIKEKIKKKTKEEICEPRWIFIDGASFSFVDSMGKNFKMNTGYIKIISKRPNCFIKKENVEIRREVTEWFFDIQLIGRLMLLIQQERGTEYASILKNCLDKFKILQEINEGYKQQKKDIEEMSTKLISEFFGQKALRQLEVEKQKWRDWKKNHYQNAL